MPSRGEPVVDRDVHQVPDGVVARADQVADQPVRREWPRGRCPDGFDSSSTNIASDHGSGTRAARSRSPAAGRRRSGGGSRVVGHSVAWRLAVAGSRGARTRGAPADGRRASRQTCERANDVRRDPPDATRTPAASRTSAKSYRPVPSRQRVQPASRTRSRDLARAAPRTAARAPLALVERGEHLAPPGVDQRQPQLGASIPAASAASDDTGRSSSAARVRERARGGHADPQAGERARARRRPRSRRGRRSPAPASPQHRGERRHQLARVAPAARDGRPAGSRSNASPSARSTQRGAGRRRGVEAEDVHDRPRSAAGRRPRARCATRAATRSSSGSADLAATPRTPTRSGVR